MAPKRNYERSTAAMTLERLPDAIREALIEHAERRELTVDGGDIAYLTSSRRLKRPGLFARMTGTADQDEEHLTAAVVGARDIFVVTHGEERGTHVLSARLEDVDVTSLADELAGTRLDIVDEGVTVTGFPTSVDGVTARGSFFVGLGPPDGDRARTALREAVRAAKAR